MKLFAILSLLFTLSISYPVFASNDACPSVDLVKQTQFITAPIEETNGPYHYNVLSQFIDSDNKIWNVTVLNVWADTEEKARNNAQQALASLSFHYADHGGSVLVCHYLTGDRLIKYLLGYDVVAKPSTG